MRIEDPQYRYILPMREAFEAAKVTPGSRRLAERIVRVIRRMDAPRQQRRPA